MRSRDLEANYYHLQFHILKTTINKKQIKIHKKKKNNYDKDLTVSTTRLLTYLYLHYLLL